MKRYLDLIWHRTLKRPHQLACRIDMGTGQPVVFLHGIAARAENWKPVIAQLDHTKYRAIALDILGFGDSPRPDWLEYSADDHAASVMATLKRMRIKGPIILVGHSMGSLIAARITRQYHKRVIHLIMYQAPVYSEIPDDIAKSSKRLKLYLSIYEKMVQNPEQTLRFIALLGRLTSRAVAVELNKQTWTAFEMSLRNTIMQQKIYDDLGGVHVPVDIVYGRLDMFVVRRDMKKMFKQSSNISFYEINETHRISKKAATLIQQLIVKKRDIPHDKL